MSEKMTVHKLELMLNELEMDLLDRLRRFMKETGTCVIRIDVETEEVKTLGLSRRDKFVGLQVKTSIPCPYIEPEE